MQIYEVSALLEKMQYRHRDAWEQTRLIMYVIAQSNSKKKLSPEEIMKFPWEDEKGSEERMPEPTEEEVNALREKMKQYIKNKESCQQI